MPLLTVRYCVTDLLRWLEPEQRAIPYSGNAVDDPIEPALNTIRETFIELSALGDAWPFRAYRTATIYAPVSFTIASLTAGVDTFTLAAPPWQDWMVGCTIKIDGDDLYNQIVGRTGSTVQLLHPPAAGGSNVSAKVWCDCITVADDVMELLKPVVVPTVGRPLWEIARRPDARAPEQIWRSWYASMNNVGNEGGYGYDNGWMEVSGYTPRIMLELETPYAYFLDTNYQTGSVNATQIRLFPLPTTQKPLRYRARIAPPTYTLADVYDAGNPSADPNTVLPLSENLARAVFLPLLRQRFTGCPFFNNEKHKATIAAQSAEAMMIWNKMQPATDSSFQFGAI